MSGAVRCSWPGDIRFPIVLCKKRYQTNGKPRIPENGKGGSCDNPYKTIGKSWFERLPKMNNDRQTGKLHVKTLQIQAKINNPANNPKIIVSEHMVIKFI